MRVYAVQSALRTSSSLIRNVAAQEATSTNDALNVAVAQELPTPSSGRSFVVVLLTSCVASRYLSVQYYTVRCPGFIRKLRSINASAVPPLKFASEHTSIIVRVTFEYPENRLRFPFCAGPQISPIALRGSEADET